MSDRYQIQAKIGQGGLGAVYKAFDSQLKREVALKRVLTPEEGSAEEVTEAAEKLMKEATVLSALMHPNIVTVFDIGKDESGGFVVMELLDGETLDETIGRGLLTPRDFGEVVNQTLEAMIAAQSVNLLHRDLKPTNVMVIWRPSGKFQIKILDFGLAKISEQPSIQTIDHGDAILGSIYFMAPEQFERRKLDFRTDMYALGCIYYYSLTGKYPFDGESAPQVMAAHLQHKVKPLKEMRPDLPDDICQWVMWLINRDITKRPGNAREALERFPDPDNPNQTSAPVYVAQIVDDAPLEAIPVPDGPQETPKSTTGGVVSVGGSGKKFKTGPTAAKGKTGGVTSGVTGRTNLKTGPVGGTGATTGQQLSHADAAAELEQQSKAKKKKLGLLVLTGISTLIVLSIIFSWVIKNNRAKAIESRMVELVNMDPPRGTAADIAMLVRLMDPKRKNGADPRARALLATIEGSGLDEEILKFLQSEQGTVRNNLVGISRSREIEEAFDEIYSIFRGTTDGKIREICASAFPVLADSQEDLTQLLSLLRNEPLGAKERQQIESAVITLIRMEENLDTRVDPIIKAIDQSPGGDERVSLLKILGSSGGKKAQTKLETIFTDGDKAYQKEAMSGVNLWPDRGANRVLNTILTTTDDAALKKAAIRARTRLMTLPSRKLENIVFRNLVQSTADNQQEAAKVLNATFDRPSTETIEFLKGLKIEDQALVKYRDQIITEIQKLIDSGVNVKSGELISIEDGHIRGSSTKPGNYYNSEAGYLENWNDPNVWVTWVIKVDQPGKYEIAVLAACDGPPGSRIEVIVGDNSLRGQIRRTAEWDEFSEIKLGEVSLPQAGDYVLFLQAGKVVQRRIANLQGVRITKK